MFENPRRGKQARNFTTNVPKILDLKSSSEQIFSEKLSLGAPVARCFLIDWSQKTTTHRCLSLFPSVSRLGYRTNWLLRLGEVLLCMYLCSLFDVSVFSSKIV